jgi:hypothetical protein
MMSKKKGKRKAKRNGECEGKEQREHERRYRHWRFDEEAEMRSRHAPLPPSFLAPALMRGQGSHEQPSEAAASKRSESDSTRRGSENVG